MNLATDHEPLTSEIYVVATDALSQGLRSVVVLTLLLRKSLRCPTADRVILWTRLTPRTVNETTASYEVTWTVYSGVDLATVVQSGSSNTSADTDFTVKVSTHAVGIRLNACGRCLCCVTEF